MEDIFISYSRKQRKIASRLADRLKDEGWTVFWDRDVIAGDNWKEHIKAKASQAGCVVVLWSTASVKSSEVREEAMIGLNRHVLVPALLAPVLPPEDFRKIHATDLEGWDGSADNAGLTDFIFAIARKIGNPAKTVSIAPVDFVIVVGRRRIWRDLGPAFNLTCLFKNKMGRPVTIHHMEASTAGPEGHSHHFVWKLLYDPLGGKEHKPKKAHRFDLPEGTFGTGIQFRATGLDNEIKWPGGGYRCQILGWAERKEDQPPNLRTEFKVFLHSYQVAQVKELLSATDKQWRVWKIAGAATNNARGVRAIIGQIRSGLPAVRPVAVRWP